MTSGRSSLSATTIVAMLAVLAAVLFVLGCFVAPVRAADPEADPRQAWIHEHNPTCCDHRDCRPAVVTMVPGGWQVEGTDNIIPADKVIPWPFALPYACVVGRYARCLFMDAGG